jgi:outer membrane protein OmpA-like peptidoglycan-associated protein
MRGALASVLIVWMAALPAPPPSGAAEADPPTDPPPAEGVFKEVGELLTEARTARADLLSPGHFAAGQKLVAEAQQLYRDQRAIKDIQEKIDKATGELQAALDLIPESKLILGDALAARDQAQAVEAQTHAGSVYAPAEEAFKDGALKLEAGKSKDAKVKAADAERGFKAAELEAIRLSVLGEAKKLVSKAEKEKATVWAPRHFTSAKEGIAEAERLLADDRSQRDPVAKLAKQAEADARRGLAIAAEAQAAAADRSSYEAKLMDAEAQIHLIGGAIDYEPDFEQGLGAPAQQIVQAIQGLEQERDALKQELAHTRKELDSLAAKGRGLSAELEAKREKEARVQRVTQLFTPDEAVVIRQPGRLILRLKGVNFERGEAVIMPESYALLAKVIRATAELPGASITIQGHTDSQGDAQRNLVLSQERAEAVRAYLEANAELADRLVTTVGLGESTPVATNDTAEGRALNRRIDVVFDAPSLIGD